MRFLSRTPLRVSLFGGGTDYPAYLEQYPGCVLGTTIDQYVYIVAMPMSPVAQWKFRLTYRQTEEVQEVAQIQHPVVRAVLSELNWRQPLNIATMADLPGGTGLGSSSAFTVGFINLISKIRGAKISRLNLALEAIRIERDVLRENVGVQDQIHAAFGGLNMYRLEGNSFSVTPINMSNETEAFFNEHLLLVFSGLSRHASSIVEDQVQATRAGKNITSLDHLVKLAEEAKVALENPFPERALAKLGALLHDSWMTKRSLSPGVSTELIDEIYAKGRALGALGGKLCGAGGGGFVLFLAPPETHQAFIETFGAANVIKIRTVDHGSDVQNFG